MVNAAHAHITKVDARRTYPWSPIPVPWRTWSCKPSGRPP